MAAEEIITLVLDDGEFKGNLIKIDEQIAKNRKELTELNKKVKEGTELNADERKEYERLNKEMIDNRQTRQQLIKAQSDSIKGTVKEEGSINSLRAQLSRVVAERNKLSEAEREGGERGKALTAQAKALNDQLKQLEGRIGDNRRSVGGYEDAIKKAFAGTKVFGQGLDTLGATIKANPIGLLVTVLVSLLQSFKSITPVTDRLNIVFGAISATIDVLIARAGKLVDAFGFLLSGDLRGAVNSVGEAYSGLADDIGKAITRGAELAKIQKELTDAADAQRLANEKNREQLIQLEAQFRDLSKTEEERLAIAEEIARVERENFEQNKRIAEGNQQLAERELRAILETKKIREDITNATTEELLALGRKYAVEQDALDKLTEAEITLSQQRQQSLALTERIAARANTIAQQQEQRREREAEKERLRRQKLIEEEQKYQDTLAKLSSEFLDSDLKRLKDSFEAKLDLIEGIGGRETQLRQAILDEQSKAIEAFLDNKIKKEAQAAVANQNELAQIEINAIRARLLRGELTERQAQERVFQIRQQSLQAQRELLEQAGLSTIQIDTQIIDAQIANQQRLTAAEQTASQQRIAVQQAEFTARAGLAQGFFNFFNGLAEDQSALGKVLAFGALLASQAQAIGQAVLNATLSAGATGPAALFTQPAFIAQSVGSVLTAFGGAFNLIKGFAAGGLVTGNQGISIRRNNGDNLLATIKTGEVILNEFQQRMLGGPDVFRAIGVPGFADGGVVGRAAQRAGVPDDNLISKVIQETFRNLPPTFVAVTDINDGQQRFASITNNAEV
jgi:hypothetical protein